MQPMKSCLTVIAATMLYVQAASAAPLKVIAVPEPLVPYTAAILGEAGSVEPLLNKAQDPHHFALSPSQARKLAQADMLLLPDAHLNPTLTSLAARYPSLKIVTLSSLKGAQPLPYNSNNAWLGLTTQKAEGHDPHLWLDPMRMAALAPALAETLDSTNPALARNAQALATHLTQVTTPRLQALLPKQETLPAFITAHDSYQYFYARMGLPHPGYIAHGTEEYSGAKTVNLMLNAAKTHRLRCIITESPSRLSTQLAEISGARIIRLSPEMLPKDQQLPAWATQGYDGFLYHIAQQFSACL